jgi:hypothetical protein
MTRRLSSTGRTGAALFALAVLGLLPAAAAAQSVTFVNDTKVPLVVQLAVGTPRGVRRLEPHRVYPGDKVRLMVAGDKLVNVYDARLPNRVLYQGTLPASTEDQQFSMQPDPRGLPKVVLEKVKPPAMKGRPRGERGGSGP